MVDLNRSRVCSKQDNCKVADRATWKKQLSLNGNRMQHSQTFIH